MRSFALTYPQLMNQAIAAGIAADPLARLRATHELAERLADGIYRPQGEPLLCHFVRTASIVLEEKQPLAVVQAMLLHAAYSLRRRPGSAGGDGARRAWLMRAAGLEVEELVFAYDQLPWGSAARVGGHVEGFEGYDQTTRRVVLMRLANELEDHLDRSAAYASTDFARRRWQCRDACLALARAAGSPALVSELREVFDGQLDPPLPGAVVVGRDQGYTLRGKAWPELSRLRGMARALLRRMRRRFR
jgi:(p)ppGpp synthase/HD superfamily hydrolase